MLCPRQYACNHTIHIFLDSLQQNVIFVALLTQLDKLKASSNVIIMTTSNITAAIDIAFVDKVDIKAYVGPPTLQARYEILTSCLQELIRTRILKNPQNEPLEIPTFTTPREKFQPCQMQDV